MDCNANNRKSGFDKNIQIHNLLERMRRRINRRRFEDMKSALMVLLISWFLGCGQSHQVETTKKLTWKEVVGTYQYNAEEEKMNRAVFLKNGVLNHHGWDDQNAKLKWEIKNEEVVITGNFGTFFCRKESNGELTKIAELDNGVRIDLLEKEQTSGQKIK